ncbi:hypothetical protein TRAPUB_10848 [Trametes pubescens]|uniref:F-box domain-containing protein n=1 Tax=Trametes pubescens TaxID=154538 RepID=A0A1M2VYD2_TRAPU|nr:hypothetical protein TRAPUB_10848 [Trametes pubescens]
MSVFAANQPRLNHDILLAVMTFCDKFTISRMLRTCSALSRHGARLLLNDTVNINDANALDSLCQFLRADNFSRMRHFRDLALRMDEKMPRPVARQLAEILGRSTHLDTLTLTEAEPILQSHDPAIATAIASLTSLRTLVLCGAEELSRNMMLMLQSPLEEVRFEYDPHGDAPFDEMLEPDELPQYHPLFLCQNFAASLRDLDCRFASPHTGFTYPQLPMYPNLCCLTLQDDWPVLRPWIASCPNLTELSSTTHHEVWVAEDEDDDQDINPEWEELRQRNLDDQVAHGTWTHLEEYSGNVVPLYILGLTCRIPSITIDEDVKSHHVGMLRTILAEAKPKSLGMCMTGSLDDLGDSEYGIAALLMLEGCSEIETLELSLDLQRWDTFDFQGLTVHLLDALPHLPALKLLDVDISGPQKRSQQSVQAATQESSADEDVDIAGFGRRAMGIAPVLTKVKVGVWYSQPWRKGRFVRVTKTGERIAVFSK